MQADVERFLARLYVDRELRERFLRDPLVVASKAGLGPEECRAFAAIPHEDLRTAARSFARKRAIKTAHASQSRVAGWIRRVMAKLRVGSGGP
jgi:hypothetical protein